MTRKHTLPAAVRREVFPHDSDFPQLPIATDSALMLDQFRAHLQPTAGRACRIEACVPFRFRCRQSTARCVLQYTLRVADPDTGRRWDQWVTGLVYAAPGEAEQLWREMQAGVPSREIPERWLCFEPVAFIADLQMTVQLFPYDRKLRNLTRVLNGAGRGLEPLLLAGREPGRWHAEERILEPTRYRSELGAALRYTLVTRDRVTGSREALRCYLKVYRNERGAETYRLLSVLSHESGADRKPYRVVRPLAYVSELRTLVLEEAPGVALQDTLLRDTSGTAIRAVARAVAGFNQDTLPIARHHTLAEQLDEVRRAASLVQWACPHTRSDVRAITDAVVDGLREAPPAPIHRDLKTDHVFLSGDRVIFIDVDSVSLGDPVRDPAHLAAHIVARVGLEALPAEQARASAATFVAEYFAHTPPSWRDQFALHYAGALVEVAGGIFKRQEPQWPARVTAAVTQAHHALSGGSIP